MERGNRALEVVCVLVVLAAFIALIVWLVMNSGGGVLNQG
jgi:hypothetical protein